MRVIEARANAMLKDTGYYDKGTDFCSKVAKICIGVAALIAEIRRLRAIEQRAERYCISATVTQHELAILKGILNG